ncbi:MULTISPECIES: Mu transposase C-terminal domain-containing protein [Paenarthrobacter]|uniref:Mu transposase C-terminal domain-containing protein n=1 Tax=Paenarthrobacter TaxID=1742992 RepID=UPI001FB3C5D7|nr:MULTISPECIES: Mu transposase C-terminal domain-containing protein [Paenarthrobacter]MCW3767806.1 DDE-type integrase/transposase/recombinase [Paenarthrobacter sp. PAE-2]UOD83385.1 DDE-type integrase/transposase/recombinase [Paenarthrobacter ureafaciens]WNZ05128.1 DDE-type integrase/transposase/recombinase [Paenarthrobacter ureafaciens]WOC63256.1 DDE-type integrase/transposase/recombinase [Paenarthrobacter sp. AT5]
MDADPRRVAADGQLTMSDAAWEQAKTRAAVIGALAQRQSPSGAAVDQAAAELGISPRRVYVLLARYRQGAGLVTDLAVHRSTGGKGRNRLPEPVEQITRDLIRRRFMTRQKLSVAALHRDIAQACTQKGLKPPTRNTVDRRISMLNPVEVGRRREGPDAVRTLQAAGGKVPLIPSVLDQVQIDHTIIDVVIVDERERQSIGRPYLTVAIDVFSRALVGMVVTLEPPSAVSVGLCLAHAVGDKRPWLERLGLEVDWSMSGKPKSLFLDNASEFKSEALRRGCEQHGIGLSYRPLGQPHYGGIVERVIGTAMRRIHELPGTTFSNPGERGRYDSERLAALTLPELEKWLVLAVASYHGTVHSTLGQTPAAKWAVGVAATGVPAVAANQTSFLVDFLPVIRRTLTRTGFVVDHVHYFANALKPWISHRGKLEPFIVRRDPRDISRIWVLEPDGRHYVEVPYRSIANPPISMWEHRQALARLHDLGAAQVDEAALFRMIEQMRRVTETAVKTTKRIRRENERRRHAKDPGRHDPTPSKVPPPPDSARGNDPEEVSVQPFEQIEEW